MSYNMNSVIANGFVLEDFIYTYFISGSVTEADVGKAVSLDTSAANTVKLAADGDAIFGKLMVYTDRSQEKIKTAAVARKFKLGLPILSGETVTVGQTVVGAGGGFVKAGTANPALNQVTQVAGTEALVEKF